MRSVCTRRAFFRFIPIGSVRLGPSSLKTQTSLTKCPRGGLELNVREKDRTLLEESKNGHPYKSSFATGYQARHTCAARWRSSCVPLRTLRKSGETSL